MTLTFLSPQPIHDFTEFSCEDPAMVEWLQTKARPWHESRVTSVHVGTFEDNPTVVRMFFTLSASSYPVDRLDPYQQRILDKDLCRVPMILIGKLAVDNRYTRRGFGTKCVAQACLEATRIRSIGAAFVAVEPAPNRMAWYQDLGFQRANAKLNFVYLPIQDVEATFSAAVHQG